MTMLRILFVVAALVLPPAPQAAPPLFHGHGHGLSFSVDGKALLAPSEAGVAIYQDKAWSEPADVKGSFSGFAVTGRGLYASGASAPGRQPRGLVRSTDGGRSWQALALAGEADFPLLAAGYRSSALYVLNAGKNPAMPAPGIYATQDEGKSWRHAAARNLKGQIHGLAAHPGNGSIIAAATERGLYLSNDGGESFRRLDGRQPATAVAFNADGTRVRYALALAGELMESALDGRQRRAVRLPRLERDYVTCLAQSPQDAKVMAFATRRRDVYLSADSGASWRRIAAAQDAQKSEDEESE
jgi:photosystem II stability/assembly factor-like uncharacterized protein